MSVVKPSIASAEAWAAAPGHVRSVVLRHVQHAADIEMLVEIRDYLIEQVHQKKSTLNRIGSPKPVPALAEMYTKVLLHKRHRYGSWIPVAFASQGEDRLVAELSHKAAHRHGINLTQVYYNRPKPIVDGWDLEDGHGLSDRERATFERYLDLYREIFEEYLAGGSPSIKREYKRLARMFGWGA